MAKLEVVQSPVPDVMTALAEEFLADRRSRGLSIRSVEQYRQSLARQFLPWAESAGVTHPEQLTPQLVGKFTTHLLEDVGKRGKPLARATVRSYVQTTRVFLGWVADPDGGAAKVGASPKLPEKHKLTVEVLSRDELARMENAAQAERDKLIVRVLADTGLRVGELVKLTVGDIREHRPGEYFLKIHGKGSKDREVPIATALVRRVRRYLSGRETDPGDPVFVSLRRRPNGERAPLTVSGAEQAVKLAGKEAGIQKRVYAHLLRHSYATEWVRKGGDLISLRDNLGHFDLSMIQSVYQHLDASDRYAATMKVLLAKN
ncbi:MAG: tyrosine-type recombinase/integrase [Candidatus Dormibacteria bacterium]